MAGGTGTRRRGTKIRASLGMVLLITGCVSWKTLSVPPPPAPVDTLSKDHDPVLIWTHGSANSPVEWFHVVVRGDSVTGIQPPNRFSRNCCPKSLRLAEVDSMRLRSYTFWGNAFAWGGLGLLVLLGVTHT
jgi:hypothetical protein